MKYFKLFNFIFFIITSFNAYGAGTKILAICLNPKDCDSIRSWAAFDSALNIDRVESEIIDRCEVDSILKYLKQGVKTSMEYKNQRQPISFKLIVYDSNDKEHQTLYGGNRFVTNGKYIYKTSTKLNNMLYSHILFKRLKQQNKNGFENVVKIDIKYIPYAIFTPATILRERFDHCFSARTYEYKSINSKSQIQKIADVINSIEVSDKLKILSVDVRYKLTFIQSNGKAFNAYGNNDYFIIDNILYDATKLVKLLFQN